MSQDIPIYHSFNNEANTSGLDPRGRAILVELYAVPTHSGPIELPADVVRQSQLAQQRAVVVACGPSAYAGEPTPRCKPGDHIIFGKYAGYQAEGPGDGKAYRLIEDNAVFCIMTVHQDSSGQTFKDEREL